MPLAAQTINRQLLNQVLLERASVKVLPSHKQPTMCFEEENAVRYASGYVALKVMRKFEKENTEKAAQFVNCVSQMALCGEESSFYAYTTEWIKRVNRGGLFSVSESTFLFFRTIELKTQLYLSSYLQGQSSASHKDILLRHITDDDDVQFHWLLQSVDIQNESHSAELLRTIVDYWVKIRGFALTSMWLEEYKKSVKKSAIKGKKSLRKDIKQKSAEAKKSVKSAQAKKSTKSAAQAKKLVKALHKAAKSQTKSAKTE